MNAIVFRGPLVYIDTDERIVKLSDDLTKFEWYQFNVSVAVMKANGLIWLGWIGLPVRCVVVNGKLKEMFLVEET